MARRLGKLPALPSFGIKLGETSLTCTDPARKEKKEKKNSQEAFLRTSGEQVQRRRNRVHWRAWQGDEGRGGQRKAGRVEKWLLEAIEKRRNRRVWPSQKGQRCLVLAVPLPPASLPPLLGSCLSTTLHPRN